MDCLNHRKARAWKPRDFETLNTIAFSPDGNFILTAKALGLQDEQSVTLWSCANLDDIKPIYHIHGHQWGVSSVTFSPDGHILATGSLFGRIMLWDAATGDFLHELVGHKQGVTDLAFSPDGKTLASANDDETIKLWHVATGRELLTFNMPLPMHKLVFSPDGKTLAAVFHGYELQIWKVPSFEEIERTTSDLELAP
jgi:WD40 repeat protein